METLRNEFGYIIQKGGTNQYPSFHIVDPNGTCIMRKSTERQANNYLNNVLKSGGYTK